MTVAANKLKPTILLEPAAQCLSERAPRSRRRAAHDGSGLRRRRRWAVMWIRGHAPRRLSRRASVFAVLAVAVLLGACSSKRVLVAPRLDLAEQGRVGLVMFTIENAKGDLDRFATERFMAEVFAGQQRVEVLELGPADAVLDEVGEAELNARAAQRIGDAWDVPAVFIGHLTVSDVKPRGVLAGLSIPRMEASVTVDLSVKLLSTGSGATIWSSRATASETVGELGLIGGDVYFSAENPSEAYGRLVDHLVFETTRDLRPSWVKQ